MPPPSQSTLEQLLKAGYADKVKLDWDKPGRWKLGMTLIVEDFDAVQIVKALESLNEDQVTPDMFGDPPKFEKGYE